MYISIDFPTKKLAEVSLAQYALLELIRFRQGIPGCGGVCQDSRQYLADQLDMTKRWVQTLVGQLVEAGLLEVKDKHGLAVTQKWYDILAAGKTLGGVNFVHGGGEESSPQGVKKVHPRGEESSPLFKEERKEEEKKQVFPENFFEAYLNAWQVEQNQPITNAWLRHGRGNGQAIMEHLPGYLARTSSTGEPGKKFRKTALSYLSSQAWLNDPNPQKPRTRPEAKLKELR